MKRIISSITAAAVVFSSFSAAMPIIASAAKNEITVQTQTFDGQTTKEVGWSKYGSGKNEIEQESFQHAVEVVKNPFEDEYISTDDVLKFERESTSGEVAVFTMKPNTLIKEGEIFKISFDAALMNKDSDKSNMQLTVKINGDVSKSVFKVFSNGYVNSLDFEDRSEGYMVNSPSEDKFTHYEILFDIAANTITYISEIGTEVCALSDDIDIQSIDSFRIRTEHTAANETGAAYYINNIAYAVMNTTTAQTQTFDGQVTQDLGWSKYGSGRNEVEQESYQHTVEVVKNPFQDESTSTDDVLKFTRESCDGEVAVLTMKPNATLNYGDIFKISFDVALKNRLYDKSNMQLSVKINGSISKSVFKVFSSGYTNSLDFEERSDGYIINSPSDDQFTHYEVLFNTVSNTITYISGNDTEICEISNGIDIQSIDSFRIRMEHTAADQTGAAYYINNMSYDIVDQTESYEPYTINSVSKTNAVCSSVVSFAGGAVSPVLNGTYAVENATVREQFFVENEREIDYAYGKFGKNSDDASLALKFNQVEFEYDADYKSDPTWGQIKVINMFDSPQEVNLGQKIHYSLLDADEKSTVSMLLKPLGTASSGNALGTYRFTPIWPENYNTGWNRMGSALMMKYSGGVYISDTSSGISGAVSEPNKWHRYDVVIDTRDESQNGLQTAKIYYEGVLYAYGVLDSDKDTNGVQYIREVSGASIEITPYVRKINGTANQYMCKGDVAYLDDMTITVLDEDKEPEVLVNGKKYNGSRRGGDVAEFFAPFTVGFPMVLAKHGTGLEAEHDAFFPDSKGYVCAELGNGEKDTSLFLWDKYTLQPFTEPYTFVQYDPQESIYVDFDANSSGVNAEIGDAVPGAASQVTSGKLGKSESFFHVSNAAGTIAAGSAGASEVAVTADINTEYKKEEALWLSFDYGYESDSNAKSIYVKPQNGLSRELITISADGDVRIGQIPCSDVKLLPKQWYRFDIVLNSNLRGTSNTATIYINGIKCAENYSTYLGETSIKDGHTIESLKIAYNLAAGDATADGIYFDNLRVQLCDRFLPDITEYSVKSSDVIYNMITDSTRFTIGQYGQDTESYIGTLSGIESAAFVFDNGAEATVLPSAGEGYLKVTSVGGYDVYYSLTEGTDDKTRESIDPVEDDYNFDTEGWYAYDAPDVNVITKDGNILNAAPANPVKAGSLGAVSTSGENFTAGGRPVHFWGCNIILTACTPTHAQADKMADMVASYGFNLVRIHQLTEQRSKIFGENGDRQTLDPEQMDKFCYFINKLNEKGVYIYLDLGRPICDKDVSDGLIDRKSASNTIYWFEDDYRNIQIEFAKQLLTYNNPYTNKRICDSNAIIGVQCANETYIYEDPLEELLGFDSEEYQYYYAKMNEKFDAWYRKTYPNYLTQYESIGLSQAEARGELITVGSRIERGIVQRADGDWGYLPWAYTERKENLIRFFNEMQGEYFAQMQSMFDANSINVPMTGSTVCNSMDLALMDANLDTQFIDTHTYWGHPVDGVSIETGARFRDYEMQSSLKSPSLGLFGYIMNRKPYNKPYTVSEWNECAGNRYMSEAPLMMAAYSKYQNWNPMLFLFTDSPMNNYENKKIANAFSMAENPIMQSTMQAAVLTWRNVSEAGKSCYVDYSGTKSYEYSKHHHEQYNSDTGLWVPAEHQYAGYDIITKNPTVGMLAKTGAAIRETPANDDISSEKASALSSGIYTSDTGEITFDSNKNTFTVNTSKSKAASGFFNGETEIGDSLKFNFDNEFATVYVNSVTDSDISLSNRLLLTVVGKSVNTDHVLQRSGSPYVLQGGVAPVLMEQITGTVRIKTKSAMKVYSLTSSGERKKLIPTTYNGGWLTISLSLEDECVNYEIVK